MKRLESIFGTGVASSNEGRSRELEDVRERAGMDGTLSSNCSGITLRDGWCMN